MSNPFAAAVAQAEATKATKAAEAAQAAIARQEFQAQKAAAIARQNAQTALRNFGNTFLAAAAKNVRPGWSPEYILCIKAHAESLLRKGETEGLPKINVRHRTEIEAAFRRELNRAERYGKPVLEGTFYGQQLLAEQAAVKALKPERINIRPGVAPKGPRAEGNTANQAELPSATTPKTKGRDRRPAKAA